nr:uncharacterized protein LOC129416689 [Misgurnus anguillicaudatus]
MATPEPNTSKSAPASCQRPRRTVQRPVYLDDYMVSYPGNPSKQTVRPKEKPLVTSTPISPQVLGTAGSSDELMMQIVEITRQQSETARRQTELLEKVLLHSTPRASPQSSRASSRHQTPRARILQSVEKGHLKSDVSLSDVDSNPFSWPQPAKLQPTFVEELSQVLTKTHIRDSHLQSPPPVGRENTLSSHQYASPCYSAPLDPARSQLSGKSEPWNKPLPPLPEQRPSRITQLSYNQVPSAEIRPDHSQMVPETVPMPQFSNHVTSQLRADAVPYYPQLPPFGFPGVEGPTFPDFTKEDRAQYVELRMALDNLLHPQLSEHYKYSILLKHAKVPNAHRLVLAHAESTMPYTNALQALDRRYGRPYQFVLREIETLENLPPIRPGDERAFDDFSLRVQAIVGMLKALKGDGVEELHSGSNVKRLLNRLPRSQQTQFRRHHLKRNPDKTKFSLLEFADWLQLEANCMEFDPTDGVKATKRDQRTVIRGQGQQTTIMHGIEQKKAIEPKAKVSVAHSAKPKAVCPYCSMEHYLSQCTTFIALTKEQKVSWIKDNKRC